MQWTRFAAALPLNGLLACSAGPAGADGLADIRALFARAEHEAKVGIARKTRAVDARPAEPGERVVSIIAKEGKETQSPAAKAGDMVVRNRCPETGNEEILVSAAKFQERYEGPIGPPGPDGWHEYRPRGNDMQYFVVGDADGAFTFIAPWGEPMVARPGDAIVRSPTDISDTYRVARAAFACTYEIVRAAR
jgi:hypothetical protein